MFVADGQITHLDVFLFLFFFIFRKQKSTVSGWQQKVRGSLFFPAKHNASNIKAAVVTQLDYSYYSWRKPIIILIVIYYYFMFEGRY